MVGREVHLDLDRGGLVALVGDLEVEGGVTALGGLALRLDADVRGGGPGEQQDGGRGDAGGDGDTGDADGVHGRNHSTEEEEHAGRGRHGRSTRGCAGARVRGARDGSTTPRPVREESGPARRRAARELPGRPVPDGGPSRAVGAGVASGCEGGTRGRRPAPDHQVLAEGLRWPVPVRRRPCAGRAGRTRSCSRAPARRARTSASAARRERSRAPAANSWAPYAESRASRKRAASPRRSSQPAASAASRCARNIGSAGSSAVTEAYTDATPDPPSCTR
ncbi:hypothetical protein SMICM304S_03134 [Streptomyces microflavus]